MPKNIPKRSIGNAMPFIVMIFIVQGCFNLDSDNSTACEMCTIHACDNELAACRQERDCVSRFECLSRCDAADADCRGNCPGKTPPTQAMLKLDICRSKECMSECDSCGASMFDGRGSACSNCLRKKDCCAASTECALDEKCSETMRSRLACTDPFCVANDGLSYDSERTRYESVTREKVEACIESCEAECGLGSDFTCNHSYRMPDESVLESGGTLVQLRPVAVYSMTPLTDVTIEALYDDLAKDNETIEKSDDGRYLFKTGGSFDGSFFAQKNGFYPISVLSNRPFFGNEFLQLSFVREYLLHSLDLMMDKPVDLVEKGILMVQVMDCMHHRASGLHVRCFFDDEEKDDIIKIDTNGTDLGEEDAKSLTDSKGVLIFLNAPAGDVAVTVTLESGEEEFIKWGVNVEKGRITYALMFPVTH